MHLRGYLMTGLDTPATGSMMNQSFEGTTVLRTAFESSIWKNRSRPSALWMFERHVWVRVSDCRGIRVLILNICGWELIVFHLLRYFRAGLLLGHLVDAVVEDWWWNEKVPEMSTALNPLETKRHGAIKFKWIWPRICLKAKPVKLRSLIKYDII